MTYRLGWIGCGRHAEQMLLPQLARHDVELVAVCDMNMDTAQKIGQRYGVKTVVTDFRELLELADLDVVGMAVGPMQHRDMSIAALTAAAMCSWKSHRVATSLMHWRSRSPPPGLKKP